MRQNRRKFLKNGLITAAAAFIAPSVFEDNEVIAAPVKLNYKPDIEEWDTDQINISWLGHSTVLINFFGRWILTDPVLFNRVGLNFLGTTIGPSRLTPPALTIDEIPKPDIVLLSHGHMDHTDHPTLSALTKKFPGEIDVVVAYLTGDIIRDLDWKSITVLDWDEEAVLSGINIKAFEVEHFGWRFPWEKDRSRGFFKDGRSYNSYLIEYKGKRILFGGDTRYTNKFAVLKNKNIDIAVMPIGAYNPWKQSHCNPEEALKMADDFHAKYFIPIHCKTFQQGREPFNEPIDWLITSAPKYKVKVALEEIGQTFTLS